MSARYRWDFTDDAEEFSQVASGYLAERSVVENVVATVVDRTIRERAEGVLPEPGRPWWFASVRDPRGRVVGVAMRTAPPPGYLIWAGEMPDSSAYELAAALQARDEDISMINGAERASRIVATELARRCGRSVETGERSRLLELGELVPPSGVAGALRPARSDDVDLVHAWRNVFPAAAAEQARRRVRNPIELDLDDTRRRIRDGCFWLWEDAGRPVHLTGANPPSAGVARIGPVYTPREFRGHGYANAAVAAVSRILLGQGARVCLFADQRNPISNRIYQRIGYRPVVDMAQLIIV